ncbi:LysR substrate-binding domain-containing protein [Aerococcus urinaeequi]|uniref:LysR substrate-binding domain-containing protein n=1 Tax=Aerococcus urinaeequi TaxID=51665 RepID=UPI003AAF7E69
MSRKKPTANISMFVENTHILQEMLWEGKIYFALLEGHFNRQEFAHKSISNEEFIAVCSPKNILAKKANLLENLLDQQLILREPGSGTRDILEQALYNRNLHFDDFTGKTQITNMNVIKALCHRNIGITFMYRKAVKKELATGYLVEIPLVDFNIQHPFNFVYLKDPSDKQQIESLFETIMRLR